MSRPLGFVLCDISVVLLPTVARILIRLAPHGVKVYRIKQIAGRGPKECARLAVRSCFSRCCSIARRRSGPTVSLPVPTSTSIRAASSRSPGVALDANGSSHLGRQGEEAAKSCPPRPTRATRQTQSRQSLHGAQQRDLCFESRNSHARTRMRSGGEREVAIGPAGDIEALRIRELPVVAVGRANAQGQ